MPQIHCLSAKLIQQFLLAHTLCLSESEIGKMNVSSIQLADGSEDYIAVAMVGKGAKEMCP
jgi:hypothetical protein